MCIKIIDNTKEISLEEALVYLQSVKQLTHDNEIVWTFWRRRYWKDMEM